MLDHLSPPRRRLVLAVIALGATGMVAVAVLVLLRVAGPGGAADQADEGPVLLVTGYGGRVASLDPVVDLLEGEGREVRVVAPAEGGRGDLRGQARALDEAVEDALADAGAGSVDVVGYSAGGVVARIWARDLGGAEVARRVVTIGSPHHGTELAGLAVEVLGGCPLACEQLAPGSDVLRALAAGDETPAGPAWVSVWTTADRVVTPPVSARLEGALDVVVQDVCPGSATAHEELPGDPVVLAAIRASLGTGPPTRPTDVSCGRPSS